MLSRYKIPDLRLMVQTLAAPLLILAVTAVLAWLSATQMSELADQARKLDDRSVQTTAALANARYRAAQLGSMVLRRAGGDFVSPEEYASTRQILSLLMQQSCDLLENRQLIVHATKEFQEFLAIADDAMARAGAGRTTEATMLMFDHGQPVIDAMVADISTLLKETSTEAHAFADSAERQRLESSVLIARLLVIGFLGGALASGAAAVSVGRAMRGERLRSETRLRAQNERFETAVDNMVQGLALFDAQGHLALCNDRLASLFGLPDKRRLAATDIAGLAHLAVRHGMSPDHIAALLTQILDLQQQTQSGSFVAQLDDAGRFMAVTMQPLPDGGHVLTFEDITERRQAEMKIRHMAHHDGLTNLPNRVLLQQRLDQAVSRIGGNEGFALFCIDLDAFKGVNDTFGHAAGDALLRETALRLQRSLRESDTVARAGGDEFVIIMRDVRARGVATLLADRLLEEFARPFEVSGHTITAGISIGIALAPENGVESDTLLQNADMALYRAKSEGKGRYRFFEPGMDSAMLARRKLEHGLRAGLADQQLVNFYHPLIDIEAREVRGLEALVRWHHPELGLVLPGEFITVAEESGLIHELGEQVLRQACLDAMAWPVTTRVAVNLSSLQVRQGKSLVRCVERALGDSGLLPERLELEVTESVLLRDTHDVLATLHLLRRLGVGIAMDDFGTGYSSLSYLRQFPFQKVKIDRYFIRDITEQEDSQTIVRAVVDLCRTLGMRTTAEGIETSEQLRQIRDFGCTEAQGFLFGHPAPRQEIPPLLSGDAYSDIWNRLKGPGVLAA